MSLQRPGFLATIPAGTEATKDAQRRISEWVAMNRASADENGSDLLLIKRVGN